MIPKKLKKPKPPADSPPIPVAVPSRESPDSGIPPGAVFRVNEVAEILKLHPRTIKRMVGDGRLRVADQLGSSVRIPRSEVVRIINTPRALALLQRTEGRNLGFNPVDMILGSIPEPDPREMLGFLLQKRRADLVLAYERYLPLGEWANKRGSIDDNDAVSWCYLRFVALQISKFDRNRRKALRQLGSDPLLVIKLFSRKQMADLRLQRIP